MAAATAAGRFSPASRSAATTSGGTSRPTAATAGPSRRWRTSRSPPSTSWPRDHLWHMETLAKLCGADEEILRPTSHRIIDVTDPASEQEGVAWWEEIT